MPAPKNILFIMCDQLRFDYLGCYGHPRLADPEHRRAGGARRALHPRLCPVADLRAVANELLHRPLHALARLELERLSAARRRADAGRPSERDRRAQRAGRQDPYGRRHRGHGAARHRPRLGERRASRANAASSRSSATTGCIPRAVPRPRYDAYLRAHGFAAANPWEEWANSAEGGDGEILNGWLLAHADKPARIPEEHSETPYTTRRAMAFIDEAAQDGRPWCLHLSYIKPHWPYIAPAPYHAMYGAQRHPAGGARRGRARRPAPGLPRLDGDAAVAQLSLATRCARG